MGQEEKGTLAVNGAHESAAQAQLPALLHPREISFGERQNEAAIGPQVQQYLCPARGAANLVRTIHSTGALSLPEHTINPAAGSSAEC